MCGIPSLARPAMLDGFFSIRRNVMTTSQQDPGTHHRSSTVGCQTDRTQTVSVGTQWVETLSVGTETVECKVSAVSVATQLSWGKLKLAHLRSKGIQATVSFKSVGTETSTYPEFPLASTPIKGPGLGPSKRPRLELEEEQGETSTEFEETLDSSYHPDDSVLAEESDLSQWESQPIGSTPVGNLQLSAATYFTGASFFQLQKICRAMQLEIFQYETFTTTPPGGKGHSWRRYESRLPGHSAKFGSYTLMHLGSNTIVDFQLVQL
ncbi:Zinc finger protein 276 [Dissostichus eleginoides]|uniref:Zinc finger protein 276 n=1 Tax=Dissostichus eleginoides TaxID=100907 RepID=A0AAD9FIU7_DISEL|nr:Zinc finger protein 276 [Dissostichus eleginoides]